MPSRQRSSLHRICERRPAQGRRLSLWEAAALGVLQGPTELLPVSSSGHTALIPWLAGWPYAELEPELRKSFEVALHTGAGAALAFDMRGELIGAARALDRRRAAVIALSLALPAIVGYALEQPIERRLGGARSIAAGLIAGAVAMAMADARPGRGEGLSARGTRREADAGPRDGLALGLAQAVALIPGVSRNGATLTAARRRGFARQDAALLSWHAALPVMLGASALKALGLWRRGAPGGAWPVLAAGAGSAFVSTSASARLLRRPWVSSRSLLPYAVYRCMIAAIAIMRLRSTQNRGG